MENEVSTAHPLTDQGGIAKVAHKDRSIRKGEGWMVNPITEKVKEMCDLMR